MIRKFVRGAGALAASLFMATAAFAQEAVETTAEPALDTGDTTWMMVSAVLVLAMFIPGLALFYGGLARTKNMLSVLTQVLVVACMAMIVWVCWGYSMANTEGNAFFGGFDKAFLAGVSVASMADTIPEFVDVSFQMTFAAITAALVVGGMMERIKFSALLLALFIWLTIVYFPLAYMVWGDGLIGTLGGVGALDFAGGTVVHINAGVSALVGALLVGKRLGYLQEPLPPHSLTMTMIGASLLWVGWFGFNAGSAYGANNDAGLAMLNTFTATAGATLAWVIAEAVTGRKPTLLGACSGVIAGLVVITPAAGHAGPFGAIVLGAVASLACYLFVAFAKPKLGFDDTADVFGIHGVAGIVGSIGVAITNAPGLGGPGEADYVMGSQLVIQLTATAIAIAWAAIGSLIAFSIAKVVLGLRVTAEEERDGLDISTHGERAYNY